MSSVLEAGPNSPVNAALRIFRRVMRYDASEMCFFFILGVTPREKRIGTQLLHCEREGRRTQHVIYERRLWFNLFFVPLFPVSRKETIARCESCATDQPHEPLDMQELPRPSHKNATKHCAGCGAEVIGEAAYCQYCGHKF